MAKVKDLAGKRFGMLTAQQVVGRNKHGNAIWRCVCDCLNVVDLAAGNLTPKRISCGCFREGGVLRKNKPYWLAYKNHKFGAKSRKIEFLLTYEEWLKIWQDSGHLHERGKKKGQYVMGRFGDMGPYAVGNVKILSFADNTREGCLGVKHSKEHRNKQIVSLKVSWAEGKRKGRIPSPEELMKRSIGIKKSWIQRRLKNV